MRNLLFLILSVFLFTACSQKQSVTPVIAQAKHLDNKLQIDEEEELDEFDDEFTESSLEEVSDPFISYNRVMTNFNDTVYLNVLNPVAKGYAYVMPKPVRVGVSNVFRNLLFPIRFTNNLLQLKLKNATEELGRFVINSTIGVFGIWDPAKKYFNLEAHPEDFGQTLGHYGVAGGPHVVLPLLGPSNVRDMFSLAPDFYLDPTSSTGSSQIGYKIPQTMLEGAGVLAFGITNTTSLRLGQYESIKKDAVDLYTFFRDSYEQRRKQQIKE